MSLFDQEINFDMGHLLLLISLVGFIFFIASRCRLSCSGNDGKESLDVAAMNARAIQPLKWKSCRCPDCEQAALSMAENGHIYGCDPNNPFVPYSGDECNYEYRKTSLHGCGIA